MERSYHADGIDLWIAAALITTGEGDWWGGGQGLVEEGSPAATPSHLTVSHVRSSCVGDIPRGINWPEIMTRPDLAVYLRPGLHLAIRW